MAIPWWDNEGCIPTLIQWDSKYTLLTLDYIFIDSRNINYHHNHHHLHSHAYKYWNIEIKLIEKRKKTSFFLLKGKRSFVDYLLAWDLSDSIFPWNRITEIEIKKVGIFISLWIIESDYLWKHRNFFNSFCSYANRYSTYR